MTAQFQPTTLTEWPGRRSGSAAPWREEQLNQAPAEPLRRTTARILYIDMARGLFLLLMASTHAMTLAAIPSTSALALWGPPRGWATTGLIMLCGFMVATLARQKEERARIRERVFRRARQILLVMLVSNAVMVGIRRLVAEESGPLFSFEWWSGVLFFGSEWSISGILLPIGLFLVVSPALVGLYDRCRSRLHVVALAGGLLLFAALTWSVPALVGDGLAYHHVLDLLFGAGPGGFPVIPMIASGALGFLLGVFWQPPRERFDVKTTLGAVLFFVAAGQLLSAAPAFLSVVVGRTLVDMSHLVLVITLALAITHWRRSPRVLRIIPLLGTYSLFTFLIHRVVEQALTITLRPYGLPSEIVYVLCFSGGMRGLVELILWRRILPAYDRLLRALYL